MTIEWVYAAATLWVTVGVWHTVKVFKPETVGGLLGCVVIGCLVGTLDWLWDNVLTIRIRK